MLDTGAARHALEYLRRLVESGLSPKAVTAMAEEEARRVFQEGRAALMRNWPYAYGEAQRADSPIRGRVGMVALPSSASAPAFNKAT